jgi:hypothetical protein
MGLFDKLPEIHNGREVVILTKEEYQSLTTAHVNASDLLERERQEAMRWRGQYESQRDTILELRRRLAGKHGGETDYIPPRRGAEPSRRFHDTGPEPGISEGPSVKKIITSGHSPVPALDPDEIQRMKEIIAAHEAQGSLGRAIEDEAGT